jgi:Ca-activated chloride channel family protein
MFRFEDPLYLWLLLLIPLLAVVRLVSYRIRKRRIKQFGDPKLIEQLVPQRSKYRPAVKFWLLEAALALIIVMIARPQMGRKISNDKREGIETIICLDISNSMLAQDVDPSRLEKSKMMVENLVDNFSNDKIGLVVFAGDAFVQLPITSDYVSAKMFLQNIDPSLIRTQGTDIGKAIDLAMHSFTQDTKTGKAIIVITDGEDHEGGAEEMAQKAQEAGINVYILGIGSPKGAPIPIEGGYLKDRSGNTVMTALNEEMCRKVAAAGKGVYIHVDNSSIAEEQLDAQLRKLQKGEINSVAYSDFDEQFQAVGIIAVILLIVEALIPETASRKKRKNKLFTRK